MGCDIEVAASPPASAVMRGIWVGCPTGGEVGRGLVDVVEWRRCGGRITVVAFVKTRAAAALLLLHLLQLQLRLFDSSCAPRRLVADVTAAIAATVVDLERFRVVHI